jgi:hypothetical protein
MAIVVEEVVKEVVVNQNTGFLPGCLRLHFHDCFPNVSISQSPLMYGRSRAHLSRPPPPATCPPPACRHSLHSV